MLKKIMIKEVKYNIIDKKFTLWNIKLTWDSICLALYICVFINVVYEYVIVFFNIYMCVLKYCTYKQWRN
jgi:hypothetical protein